jgi:hypothetical protein
LDAARDAWLSAEIKTKGADSRVPWNKGRLVGQKRPLRPKEVWAIRVRLQIKHGKRDLALFNLAIDSKLLGCDLSWSPKTGQVAKREFCP